MQRKKSGHRSRITRPTIKPGQTGTQSYPQGPVIDRRRFLANSATGMAAALLGSWPLQQLAAQQAAPAAQDDWDSGIVRHLLPTVSDTRVLLKTSLRRPLATAPQLRIEGGGVRRRVEGRMNDTLGEFWQFYAEDLTPEFEYQLSLHDGNGAALCESWPLSTSLGK